MAIEVNDMFYAYSKDEEIKEKGEYGGAVTTIMKKLLEEGIVDAVVAVKVLKDSEEVELGANNTLTTAEEGVYTVEYTYSTGSVRLYKPFTINVDSSYVAPELTLMANPTMPKVELGQKGVKLPKPSFKSGDNENVDINVLSVRIEKENNSSIYYELKNNDLEFDMLVENFENVTNYADMQGNYRVTYLVQDANGKTAEKTFKISNVTANSKPSVYMSYNYTVDNNGNVVGDVNTDATTELKARYGYEEVVVPAIYGTDLVTPYKDLKLVRILRNATTKQAFYVDNIMEDGTVVTATSHKLGYNYAEGIDADKPNYNSAVAFKFWNEEGLSESELKTVKQQVAGTYYLEYRVVANNVSTRSKDLYVSGTTYYSFVVDGDYATLTSSYVPEVEIGNVKDGTYINAETKITVNVTSSDKLTKDATDTLNADSRLKNAVFYYYGEVSATLKADIEAAITSVRANADFKNESNVLDTQLFVDAMSTKYTGFAQGTATDTKNSFIVDVTDASNPKATIIAVSLNDRDNIGIATKTLNVKVTEGDAVAPEYTVDATGSSLTFASTTDKFAQGVDVTLPTVNFTDENDLGGAGDSALQMNVSYYVNSPETKSNLLQYRYPNSKKYGANSISGGVITTDEVGTYVVAYSAMDAAGNVSVVYFTFEVYDSSKPVLSVEAIGNGLTQSGSTITAKKGATITFDAILKSADGSALTGTTNTTLEVKENGDNLQFKPSGLGPNSYTFNSVGSYTVILNGNYTDANGTRTANEKRLEVVIEAPAVEWKAVESIQSYADVNEDVYLPELTTTYEGYYVVTPTVKTSTGATITPTKDSATNQWYFKTNSTSGKYTITYAAEFDDAGISINDKVYTLKVGDMTPPTITMSADVEAKLKQEITYDGTNDIEYVIDLDKDDYTLNITAKSNGKTIYSYNTELTVSDDQSSKYSVWNNLTVKLTSNDGKVESGKESGTYLIKAKGNYTLTIATTDNVGNEAQKYTVNFKVVTNSSVAEKNDTVVGIVLIIVSLVVLAGVILFFTLTGKKGGSRKSKKVNKEVAEETTEVVVEDAKVEDKVEDSAEDKE